jgi:hypothetical protein
MPPYVFIRQELKAQGKKIIREKRERFPKRELRDWKGNDPGSGGARRSVVPYAVAKVPRFSA